jgi:predicted enzyme related to lactoylglutathione lyase
MDEMNTTTFQLVKTWRVSSMQVMNPLQPGIITFYIQTDDIPASLKEGEKAGGSIEVLEMEIPNMSQIRLFRNPQANSQGLYQPYPTV